MTHSPSSLSNDVAEILISEHQIQRRVAALGQRISTDFAGDEVLFVAVLKGALLFLADLIRHVDLPLAIDFMAVSSYGKGTESSGVVRILKDLDEPIDGRHVIIVEDIVNSGRTLDYLLRMLHQRHPATLHVCTLLDKRDVPRDRRAYRLCRLRSARCFRSRLRAGLRRKLPPVAVHWRAEAGDLRLTVRQRTADDG